MNSIPILKPLWFDDAATPAMGEAFDNACRSLGSFERAVPEIIANRIIAAAKSANEKPHTSMNKH